MGLIYIVYFDNWRNELHVSPVSVLVSVLHDYNQLNNNDNISHVLVCAEMTICLSVFFILLFLINHKISLGNLNLTKFI